MSNAFKAIFELHKHERQIQAFVFIAVFWMAKLMAPVEYSHLLSSITAFINSMSPSFLAKVSFISEPAVTFAISKVIVCISNIGIILFLGSFLFQYICGKIGGRGSNFNGIQYTADLFLGIISLFSINLYWLYYMLLHVLDFSNVKYYYPVSGPSMVAFWLMSCISAISILTTINDGEPNKKLIEPA